MISKWIVCLYISFKWIGVGNIISKWADLICLYTVNGFKYSKWLKSSIWFIDETLTSTTTLGKSGPGSNSNEEVLHIPQSPRTVVSSSNAV